MHVHHLARPVIPVEVHDHHVLPLHLAEELLLVLQIPQLAVAHRQPLLPLILVALHRLQALATDILQIILVHVVHAVELVVQSVLHGLGHVVQLLLHHLLRAESGTRGNGEGSATEASRSTGRSRAESQRRVNRKERAARLRKRHPRRATETHLHHRILRHGARVLPRWVKASGARDRVAGCGAWSGCLREQVLCCLCKSVL